MRIRKCAPQCTKSVRERLRIGNHTSIDSLSVIGPPRARLGVREMEQQRCFHQTRCLHLRASCWFSQSSTPAPPRRRPARGHLVGTVRCRQRRHGPVSDPMATIFWCQNLAFSCPLKNTCSRWPRPTKIARDKLYARNTCIPDHAREFARET